MRPSQDDQKIQWSVISVILIGTFMAVLNGSIVNVALPKIMAIFNATSDSIQWVLTCYLMTLGVVMPVTGFMADRFGYKRMYFIALALFTAGSAICGLAWSINSLIAARIIQAIGGGIMTPLGMAFVYRVVPRNKIGLVMGVWGIAAMAAPAIGPTLGGYLVEYVSWRLIFYVNVPIGIINLILSSILLSETESIKGKHFDFTGLISSIIGLFCLLLALSQGSKHGWGSPYIVSLFAVAATALSIFVYNELTHPEPLLELRLFKDFQFTVSTLIGITLNIGMFGGMFLFPLLLQSVLGQSAMKTGLIVFPSAIATAVMMPISGRIFDRYGARGVVLIGLALVTVTTYMMSDFTEMTPFYVMSLLMVFRGIGMGLSMITATTAGMATVPLSLISKASALRNVILQIAASLGIAMFTTLMQHRQVFHYANMATLINLNTADGIALQKWSAGLGADMGWLSGTSQIASLALAAKKLAMFSMVEAIDDCFIAAAAICLMAVFFSLFLKGRNPVQEIPEIQANQRLLSEN